jgi:hypothetical protein
MAAAATYAVELDSGHAAFYARPERLALLVEQICERGRPGPEWQEAAR